MAACFSNKYIQNQSKKLKKDKRAVPVKFILFTRLGEAFQETLQADVHFILFFFDKIGSCEPTYLLLTLENLGPGPLQLVSAIMILYIASGLKYKFRQNIYSMSTD